MGNGLLSQRSTQIRGAATNSQYGCRQLKNLARKEVEEEEEEAANAKGPERIARAFTTRRFDGKSVKSPVR
ncbi:hypothetical protein QQP08_023355 [Theobroma cacao]|nr:hypothetical protein QQP08_023355 [Theobroma cacao]